MRVRIASRELSSSKAVCTSTYLKSGSAARVSPPPGSRSNDGLLTWSTHWFRATANNQVENFELPRKESRLRYTFKKISCARSSAVSRSPVNLRHHRATREKYRRNNSLIAVSASSVLGRSCAARINPSSLLSPAAGFKSSALQLTHTTTFNLQDWPCVFPGTGILHPAPV